MHRISQKKSYRETSESVLEQLGDVSYAKCDTFSSLRRILLSGDVVYSKNELLDLLILQIATSFRRPKIVVGIHTPIFYPYVGSRHARIHNWLYLGPIYRLLLAGVKLVIVHNEDDLHFCQDKFPHIRTVKILHGYKTGSGVLQLRDENRDTHVLFVGRLVEPKGIDVFLDTVDIVNNSKLRDNISFRVAGDGEANLNDRVAGYQQKYLNFAYLGHVPNAALNEQYGWADIVVIPSRYETLNQVALEAGAAGRVAIASDIPGPREVIIPGVTGYLFELNVNNVAKTLMRTIEMKSSEPEKFKLLGSNARKRIQDRFDPYRTAEQFFAAITEVGKR